MHRCVKSSTSRWALAKSAPFTAAPEHWRVQETAFAGLWRVLKVADDGAMLVDRLETGVVPAVLIDAMLATTTDDLPAPDYPAGTMNAPALVEELRLQAAAWQPGSAAHIINLTLLPVSDADLDTLYNWLGHREVSILSRGYGNCRITSTRLKNVWWVQYFNSMDTLILNSIEVIGMPEVALASDEDFSDSIERLREYLAMMADPPLNVDHAIRRFISRRQAGRQAGVRHLLVGVRPVRR